MDLVSPHYLTHPTLLFKYVNTRLGQTVFRNQLAKLEWT
jgi:hypothetical protein